MLVILDGWGLRGETADNAVALARTPNYDRLAATCPKAQLSASGLDVGLPEGQMGNSEVGHLNIGAGRVVMQELPRIDQAIAANDLVSNPTIVNFIAELKASGGVCHLAGLISPGGVHSHQNHAVALARLISRQGIKVVLHVITDGRDTPPRSAMDYVTTLMDDLGSSASIATVIGRFYAMDRDNRWERVSAAYRTMVDAAGTRFADPLAAVRAAYDASVTDEFIVPSPIGSYSGMKDGDGLLFFNFRTDRVRELLAAFVDKDFQRFEGRRAVALATLATMTQYEASGPRAAIPAIFAPQSMANTLGETVAGAGLTQMRMAETEKYPHVTYFLNGGRETPYDGEGRIMVPSPKVATYDLAPDMSAVELTEKALGVIEGGKHDMIVLNFANPDMVGHTGSLPAAIAAVETVDTCLGKIMTAIERQKGALLVIADHGNCEVMRDASTGEPHTAHTTNPVPVLLAGAGPCTLRNGRLADVAPTLLRLLDVPQPRDMTGQSLIQG